MIEGSSLFSWAGQFEETLNEVLHRPGGYSPPLGCQHSETKAVSICTSYSSQQMYYTFLWLLSLLSDLGHLASLRHVVVISILTMQFASH